MGRRGRRGGGAQGGDGVQGQLMVREGVYGVSLGGWYRDLSGGLR